MAGPLTPPQSGPREAAHQVSDARFELTFDEAPIGMALVGLDGRFLRVNKTLCEIVGYSPEELTGLTFQAITHPEDLDTDLALAERLRRGEIPRYELGKRYLRKDGSEVHVVLTGTVVRDHDGSPLHFIAQVEDVTEQRRAEEARRQSERRVQDLIQQAPLGIFVADLEGRYTDVNPAGCRLLAYTREELIGRTIVDLIPPADVPRLWAARQRLLQPGQVDVEEWALRHRDGSFIPVEVSAAILDDGRWQAFVSDIRERKRVEAELRQAQESLERAQRVAHLGSFDWNLRTNQLTRTPELYAIYGVQPQPGDQQAWHWARVFHPEDAARIQATTEAGIRSGRGYAMEYRIVRPDGEVRWVLAQGEVTLGQGRPERVVGTVLDITERKRAEREREESLRWLQAVLDQSPVALVRVIGARGERVELNARAEELLGRHLERSAQYADLVCSPDGKPLPREQLPSMRALRGERLERQEYLVRQADGRAIPVQAGAAPIRDAAGQVQGAVVVFQDITLLKELDRLRAEWNSVIAHDLRQPLHAIGMHAELLGRFLADPRAHSHLDSIRSSARRLNRMIDDLLDLSRLEANRLTLEPRLIDLEALVRRAVHDVTLQVPHRPMEVRIASGLPPVVLDPDRIAQVLENLLTNAVKYGAPATPIAVEVAPHGDRFSLAVTNRGRGLTPEQRERLFRRFERLGGFGPGGPSGIGLGLYITRALVEAHGGALTVESTPGETTTFCATLPLRAALPPPPVEAAAGAP